MKFPSWSNSLVKIGTVLDVPIYLDLSFMIGLGLFSSSFSFLYSGQVFERLALGLLSVVLLYSSVLLHEFGHLLTARFFGIAAERITLVIFGGMVSLTSLGKSPSQAALIASAGPVTSAVLALNTSFLLLLTRGSLSENAVTVLDLIKTWNTSLVLFNLLPCLPLDGGRIAVALVWSTKYRFFEQGYFHAVQFATRFISIPVMVLTFGAWLIVTRFNPYIMGLGFMLSLLLKEEYQYAKTKTTISRTTLEELMLPALEPKIEAIDYLRTLRSPFKPHFAVFLVGGEKQLNWVVPLETGEFSPYEELGLDCKIYNVLIAGTVEANLSVGEFLASLTQEPSDSSYVVIKDKRWVGVINPFILAGWASL
jgi:stage IV sporulation protein FB